MLWPGFEPGHFLLKLLMLCRSELFWINLVVILHSDSLLIKESGLLSESAKQNKSLVFEIQTNAGNLLMLD